MRRILGLITFALCLAIHTTDARAADGASWTAVSYDSNLETVAGFKLCDTKAAADSTCAVFDQQAKGDVGAYATIWIESTTGCSGAYAVTILAGEQSSGATQTVVVLDAVNSAYVSPRPVPRYISASLATVTGCTNLTVGLQLHYPKVSR